MKRLLLALAVLLVSMPPAWAAGRNNLEQALRKEGRFTTYLAIRAAAGPMPPARGKQTFLVPNDAALARLPADVLARLTRDPALARAFLDTLTLKGEVKGKDLAGDRPGRPQRHTTVLGSELMVARAEPVAVAPAAPAVSAPMQEPAPAAPPAAPAPIAPTPVASTPVEPTPVASTPAEPAPVVENTTPLDGGQIAGIVVGSVSAQQIQALLQTWSTRSTTTAATAPAPSPDPAPVAFVDVPVTGGLVQEVSDGTVVSLVAPTP